MVYFRMTLIGMYEYRKVIKDMEAWRHGKLKQNCECWHDKLRNCR